MNTLAFTSNPPPRQSAAWSPSLAELRRRFGPLVLIVLAHVLLFYTVNKIRHVVHEPAPPALTMVFIAPVPPSAPRAPKPLTPPAVIRPPMMHLSLVNVEQMQPVLSAPAPAVAPPEHTQAPAAVISAPTVAAVAPSSGPKTISSAVEYLQAPQPIYPALSKRMGEQGKVLLRVLINEKGLAEMVTVMTSSGSARLDEAGRQAVLRALYKPHLEDGRAIAVYAIVPINFQSTN